MPVNSKRRSLLQATGAIGAISMTTPWQTARADRAPTVPQALDLTATQAVAAIREGRLGAQDYVRAVLARADSLAALNTMITLDHEGALASARAIDELRASGADLPPLAGLPIVAKDNINTANLPTTGGTPAMQHAQRRDTAPALQKLLDAGAILIGKANLHELAFGITSTNTAPFAGSVKNPYDTSRIPGGSSGGTAAAIAARIVPAGLGTDTGGSTRIPAALTGTAGFRPSVGNGEGERRYDPRGAIPISSTRDTIGPMARTVADIALLDAVITDAQPITASNLKNIRIGIPASFWSGIDDEVAVVMRAARDKLNAAGVEFVEVDNPAIRELAGKISSPLAIHEPYTDIPAYLEASGLAHITLDDIVAQISSPDVRPAFAAVQKRIMKDKYDDAMNVHRPALQRVYADYFTTHRLNAMMFPTTIIPATVIDAEKGSGQVSINGGELVDLFATMVRNTGPCTCSGTPGLSLYAGMTAGGLPLGLEIDGPLGSDRELLAIGMAMENVLGYASAPRI